MELPVPHPKTPLDTLSDVVAPALAEEEQQRQRRLRSALVGLRDEKELAAFVTAEREILLSQVASLCRTGGPTAGRVWMHAYADLIDAVLRRLFSLARERVAANTTSASSSAPSPVAVLATGGYGQRLLAPHSDLDITFLAARADADPPLLRELFRLVMDVLLIGAKLKVGYAYRTPDDVAAEAALNATLDHQTQTALLDARLIAGDAQLFNRFDRAFRLHLQTADFLFRKQAERQMRREKFGPTPLLGEPQIKEGAGGMRDWQTASWMARVRFARLSGGDTGYSALWRELVRRKVLTEEERSALVRDRDLLLFVRCLLHRTDRERRDHLTRPRQDRIAAMLAEEDNNVPDALLLDTPPPAPLLPHPFTDPDALMRAYYEAAARIYLTSEKIVTRCLDAPLALGEESSGLSAVRRTVALTDPVRAATDPVWPMRALAYCQTYGLTFALPTEEAVQRYVSSAVAVAANSEEIIPVPEELTQENRTAAGRLFIDLLGRPGDIGATLRLMQRTSLLSWLLPELQACMTILPGDPSHLYTVGEHSIRVMEHLTRLRPRPPSAVGYYSTMPSTLGDPTGPVEDWEEPIVSAYRELLVALDSPATLLLAALLHDVGKQWKTLRDGTRAPHALTGAERTSEICARLGCPPAMTERVTFLVREHLLMAETSRLRDLSLSDTIRDFARVVGDRETLRMLYLLTWADTSAVAPGTWTPMKARQLSELFDRADAFLAAETSRRGENAMGEAPDADLPSDSEEAARRMTVVRDRVRRQLAREAERTKSAGEVSGEAIHAYIEAMPAAYLLNTPPSVMALHLDLVTRLEAATRAADPNEDPYAVRRPVVDMRNPAAAEGGAAVPGAMTAATGATTDLTIVAWDDPQPGLLAKITGVLLAFDLNIHGVQAFTRDFAEGQLAPSDVPEEGNLERRRIVIDTLSVDHRDRPLPALKRADVEEALVRVLSGEQTLADLLARRRAPFAEAAAAERPLAQRVRLIDDAAGGGSLSLIDIEAADEPGVVYRCAARFSALGWDIHSARVSTWAGSVRCAFYVTDQEGVPIPEDTVRKALLEPGSA